MNGGIPVTELGLVEKALNNIAKAILKDKKKKSEWGITIVSTSNGYAIRDLEEDKVIAVIEEKGGLDPDIESTQSLLWFVMEYFNIQGSKHDKERVVVDIKKQ